MSGSELPSRDELVALIWLRMSVWCAARFTTSRRSPRPPAPGPRPPVGVAAALASYGPNLRALAAYLLVFQHIPPARAAQLLADMTGARPSAARVT